MSGTMDVKNDGEVAVNITEAAGSPERAVRLVRQDSSAGRTGAPLPSTIVPLTLAFL